MYKKQRIEALSDGIFAVVMTLLVIDLKVPLNIDPHHLLYALRHDYLPWFSFVVTFAIAARYWMLQHRVFELAESFRYQALFLTFVFLGFVTILPFSTALMSRYGSTPVALRLYCLNQGVIGTALILKLEHICIVDRIPRTPALQQLRFKLWSLTLAMCAAAAATFVLPLKDIFLPAALIILLARLMMKRARDQEQDSLAEGKSK